jgi:UTP:GlnB (protein PII) uridylyltransferase
MTTLNAYAHRFVESLPASYRSAFRPEVMAMHARLAEERVGVVAIRTFERRGDLAGVCIIANDVPGLLAIISEAMVLCDLDVVNAEAFTRRDGERAEAVDLFWLRKVFDDRVLSLEEADVERLGETLEGLLVHTLESGKASPPLATGLSSSESRVRFIEDEEGALSTLEIETEDRSGLLLSVSKALFAQRVQVLRCEVRTESPRRVVDRFKIAENDGTPVGPTRRLEIQVAVLNAIEPAKRLSSTLPPALDA